MSTVPWTLNLTYIIGTYPSLTTTFIDREIGCLRRLGVNLRVISIRRPSGTLSPEQEVLREGTAYLLPVSVRGLIGSHLRFALLRPLRYFGTLAFLLTRHHAGLADRFKTLMHFGEGVHAAHLVDGSPCDHIHAHFIDRAATVAMVASRLTNVPYSVTAHAADIYVRPVLLAEKIAQARFITTCTKYNKKHLDQESSRLNTSKIIQLYHGIDLGEYCSKNSKLSDESRPVILSVGRLIEKKGFSHLIRACRYLRDSGYQFECQILGEGPSRGELERLVRDLSLEGTVHLRGAVPQSQVIEEYERSQIFVLPCVVGGNGDRDGIPTVLIEAMAMELPVVSTGISGIPELVEHGVNGLLVPPADHAALAGALARLLDEPDTRSRFGKMGRQRILASFDAEQNVRRLLAEFLDRAQIPLRYRPRPLPVKE